MLLFSSDVSDIVHQVADHDCDSCHGVCSVSFLFHLIRHTGKSCEPRGKIRFSFSVDRPAAPSGKPLEEPNQLWFRVAYRQKRQGGIRNRVNVRKELPIQFIEIGFIDFVCFVH